MFCNVPVKAVIECRDVDSSIYQLPLALQKEGMDELVLDLLGFSNPRAQENIWVEIVRRSSPEARGHDRRRGQVHRAPGRLQVGLRVDHARRHREHLQGQRAQDRRRGPGEEGGHGAPEGPGRDPRAGRLRRPGHRGQDRRGRYAREKGIPYFGLCLGLQIAVIEIARNVLKLPGANSTEFDPKCADPVINMMEEQKAITDKGATMRLGSYDCALAPGTLAAKAYGATQVRERHRHRYEVNNAYLERLRRRWSSAGSTRSATWSRSSSSRATPGSSRSSSIPSSSRSPTGPIRSSRRSSRRRSGTGAAAGRRRPEGRRA
jgi:CTP synthase